MIPRVARFMLIHTPRRRYKSSRLEENAYKSIVVVGIEARTQEIMDRKEAKVSCRRRNGTERTGEEREVGLLAQQLPPPLDHFNMLIHLQDEEDEVNKKGSQERGVTRKV